MEKLLSAKDIMERYGYKKKDTAYKIMRQMPHMENPLRVTAVSLMDWEMSRMREPGDGPEGPKARPQTIMSARIVIEDDDGKHIIPRKRPKVI